ncbi:alpha/beta hydrolase [Actinomycetes bacterium KLBMP 9797]
MIGTEIRLSVGDGELAGVDFGGRGTPVLLVHGSGQNALSWADMSTLLVSHCHLVAIDLRGHGQSALDSTDPEQYWRDLGGVVRALGWSRPVLVGHSTGGYAVTAAVAAGLVDAAALCVVDGVVLDDRTTATSAQARWSSPDAIRRMRATFRYGWRATAEEMHAYIESCVDQAADDWLNAGARPELVRQMTRRSFLRVGRHWVRRPSVEEVGIVSAPDPAAPVYPSVDVYERVGCPMTIVLASDGFYAERAAQVQAITDGRPDRALVRLESNHNVPMTRPDDLAAVILHLLQ